MSFYFSSMGVDMNIVFRYSAMIVEFDQMW